MKVSVIIPTFYRGKDLARLLDTLLEQTVKPIEVIIVDDTPASMIKQVVEDQVIIARRKNVDLIYVENPGERSITIARNIGVRTAKTRAGSDIVLFLDNDLVLYPDFIQELLKTYKGHPDAVGVTGWIVPHARVKNMRYFSFETLRKLFLLFHDSENSLSFFEYPITLTKTIVCQRFSGANMSYRQNLFTEFEFDENLKGYAYMEDALFSGSIYKKYPGRLLMTPDAKCTHIFSQEGRTEKSKLRHLKLRNRKYVLTTLFGAKGLLMFGWQNFGLLVIRLIGRITKNSDITDQFL
jgi:GT2 family glycosyltransferase